MKLRTIDGKYRVIEIGGPFPFQVWNWATQEVVAEVTTIAEALDLADRWNVNPHLAPDTSGGNDWDFNRRR